MSATNTSGSSGISNSLLRAPIELNIYLGLFIFISGNISTFGNFIVFSSRAFRVRACSIYLIAESVCTFFYFNFVLVTRITQKGFLLPIINRYDPICKVRQFLSEYTHQAAFSLFAVATFDRFLSTHRSAAFRRWSNRIDLTYRVIPAVILFWFSLVSHRLFLYSTASGSCNPQVGFYAKYDAYFEVVMSGIVPPVLLITLGCLLLKNVREVAQRRVAPGPQAVIQAYRSSIQRIDGQLTTMILLQSFVAIPSFLPFGAQNMYSSVTQDWYKSPLRLAWETMIIEMIRLFSYLFYSTSFYVSCFSSRGFRKQVASSLKVKRYFNAVHPLNTLHKNGQTMNTYKNEQNATHF